MKPGEQPPQEQPQPDNSGFEIAGQIGDFVRDMGIAVAKKVGSDILRVCGLSREKEHHLPPPMSDDEARKWNVENGFPSNWRL